MSPEPPVYRALVIEDEQIAGEANAAFLTRLGFQVAGIARSGREAARLLHDDDVDLILLDLHLPDTHGLELLRRLRAAGRTCDVIAVTSARDVEVVRQAVAQGIVSYLIKPFTYAAFQTKIEHYLAYRDQLRVTSTTLGQSEVDAMLASLRPTLASSELPKGLTAQTLGVVSRTVQQAGRTSAAEVAPVAGLSRVTARRYLEYLADAGMVERHARYGGRGRPQIDYRWR